jgi:hypothetical protein
MIEQEIDVPVLAADLQMMLAADEREALAHLEQEVFHPCHERALQVPLPGALRD